MGLAVDGAGGVVTGPVVTVPPVMVGYQG